MGGLFLIIHVKCQQMQAEACVCVCVCVCVVCVICFSHHSCDIIFSSWLFCCSFLLERCVVGLLRLVIRIMSRETMVSQVKKMNSFFSFNV